MFFLCFGSTLILAFMASCVNEQAPSFKHYCRVCKKGFMCGRALGGHMRAHGIGDDNGNLDDDDNASDWEEKFGNNSNTSSKRMYQLRTNPNRLKSCRTCENCGKEFLSWKSFLEHGNGKCASDDAASESLVVSSEDGDDDVVGGGGRRWSKRKRSLRSAYATTSEEDDLLLATCLMQLANTTVELEPEESCASASKEEGRYHNAGPAPAPAPAPLKSRAKGGLFECKACKKVFNSHQALGGHRASHKKVKGCFAAKQDEADDVAPAAIEKEPLDQDFFPSSKPSFQFEPPLVGAARRKSKVHECSICHRVFNSGQALGGHKRCHWIISNSPETSSLPKFHFQDHHHHHHPRTNNADVSDKLDLNVPAWAHMSGVRRDPRNPLSFDVSTDMQLQPWTGHDMKDSCTPRSNNNNNNNNNNNEGSEKAKRDVNYVEDEADSKLKLAKLSDLNDTNVGSSQWLQVGIGSTATEAAAAAAAGDA
ncbi:uncharacterized protein LOC131022002 [Salvia miltiorrhiza]|uniref:uncharacterized protein LOC131022002 n=1 Tax=Salvia miltiorrhiza TaxID=226208 RepID=UPI0025ACD77F|nr:uncharacterized protein LOC131022002 [Salvia miltiorrhiza]